MPIRPSVAHSYKESYSITAVSPRFLIYILTKIWEYTITAGVPAIMVHGA
jgi:hypothetical protein